MQFEIFSKKVMEKNEKLSEGSLEELLACWDLCLSLTLLITELIIEGLTLITASCFITLIYLLKLKLESGKWSQWCT